MKLIKWWIEFSFLNLHVCVDARRLLGILIGSVRIVTFLFKIIEEFFLWKKNENLTVFYHLNEQLNQLVYHVYVSLYGHMIAI